MIGAIDNSIFDYSFLRGIEINTQNGFLDPVTQDGAFPAVAEEATAEDTVEIGSQKDLSQTRKDRIKTGDQENKAEKPRTDKPGDTGPGELSDEEKREVRKLKETDRKVRQHEMAHLAAAQGIAVSGANFEYKRGPDGINYAVGGDVKIDVSPEKDPQATIEKARRIAAAALAPTDPSPQDRQVAAKARQMEAQARLELSKSQQEKTNGAEESTDGPGNTSETAANQAPGTDSQNQIQNRPHPGIETYRQNQSFALVGTTADQSNLIPFLPRHRLDMVA
jgi:hypothetical protein